MGEQQSKKRGLRSSAQKEMRARHGYEEIPASSRVAGAFGDTKPDKTSDEEIALTMDEKRARRKRQAKNS